MIDWLDLLGVQETLNARSKHILFTSECAGSNSLTTKIGEVPVTLTYKMDLSFLTLTQTFFFFLTIFFPFIFISWRLITLQYCSGFCHTLT